MSEEILVKQGAPTLAGIKTGSLFPCPCRDEGALLDDIRRFREDGQFPHEVGLFLSYPPEDVQGFIDHRACDFKCAGLWKVYGDERRAQRLFSRFKHCTEDYCARWQTGWDIDRLAVATRRAGTQPASDTFRRPGLCGGGKCDTIAAMS